MTGASGRPGLHNCKDCRRQFTVTVGTIFEDSHIPLRKWLVCWFLICSSKKGISSLQIQRILDLGSYRTALFMTHRVRHALKQTSFDEPLYGVVEVDETYVGGKESRSFDGKTLKTGFTNKTPVVSLVERGGNKRSVVMKRVTAKNLSAAIAEHTALGATVMTDDSRLYKRVKNTRIHHSVNHSAKQYAYKLDTSETVVHTNTVESSFSLLKRGVIGTFHSVSEQHLHYYLAEFDHRWNSRKDSDGTRTIDGIKKAKGKRLTYKAIIQK